MASDTIIRIGGVPEHFNLPWKLAIEQQAFEQAGLNVSYTDFPGGTGAMTSALRNGELDMAIVLTEGIVADIVNGNPSKIVKTYIQSPLIWGIHVAAHSRFESVNDLQGQRYAVSRMGSGSHLMAIVDAMQRGWPLGDMTFVKVRNLDGARDSLAAGESDIFFCEKFMTKPFVDNGEFRRVGDVLTPVPCFMLAASDRLAQERPDAVKAISDTIIEVVKEFQQRPDQVQLIASRFGLEEQDVELWLSLTDWNLHPEADREMVPTVLEALSSAGIIETADISPDQICL